MYHFYTSDQRIANAYALVIAWVAALKMGKISQGEAE